MAKKKKRGFPSKQCPECGKTIHARKFMCPHCGHDFGLGAKYAKPETAKRAASPAAAKQPPTVGDPLAALNEAVTAISDLGGLAKVKEIIGSVRDGQAAIERFGGLEKAEALVESLEALKNL